MRISIRCRAALACCGAAMALVTTAPAASAETTPPSYAPATLSAEEVQQICEDVVPHLRDRITKLTERINGGPEIRGSVAWLRARAADQRSKGHTQRADQLDQRAQRRQSRIGDLHNAQQRLDAFATAHCPGGGK